MFIKRSFSFTKEKEKIYLRSCKDTCTNKNLSEYNAHYILITKLSILNHHKFHALQSTLFFLEEDGELRLVSLKPV